MKRTKICALALSSCLALGAFAGCNKNTSGSSAPATSDATTTTLDSIVFTDAETDPTEPAPVIEPSVISPEGETIVFSGEEQKNANTFVSNFAEIYFENFDKSTAGIERYLDFVLIHFTVNANSKLKVEKKGDLSYETFTFEDAQSSIGKYFSYLLNKEDCEKLSAPPSTYGDQPAGPYYADGKIWYQSGAGESYNRIAIVDFATNNGDGTMILNFTIYSIDLDVYNKLDANGLKEYYKLTPDKAKADKTLTVVTTGTAKVSVGQTSYSLISYKTV